MWISFFMFQILILFLKRKSKFLLLFFLPLKWLRQICNHSFQLKIPFNLLLCNFCSSLKSWCEWQAISIMFILLKHIHTILLLSVHKHSVGFQWQMSHTLLPFQNLTQNLQDPSIRILFLAKNKCLVKPDVCVFNKWALIKYIKNH